VFIYCLLPVRPSVRGSPITFYKKGAYLSFVKKKSFDIILDMHTRSFIIRCFFFTSWDICLFTFGPGYFSFVYVLDSLKELKLI
jgi:hypothetical protein